jgi:hypothetical protein
VGKLLPGGVYQADNGLRYRDYQSAVNAGNVDRALSQAGSSILWGLTHPVELANKISGRSAAAAPAGSTLSSDSFTGQYQTLPQGAQRPAWEQKLQGGGGTPPPAPVLPSPPTSPNTTYQAADEEYRNLLAQYGGAPGISQLAGMTSLPTGFTPTGASKQASLKDYYAAQDLQGNANLGTITSALTQGMQGAEATNMAAWAKANPGLAQQAYAKQMGAGQVSGPGGRDIGSFIGDVSKYADQGQASSDEAAFGTIANTTPAPWNTQGQAVSAPYAEANQRAAEKTSDGGMPALNTTAGQPSTWDKAAKFLNEITPFTRTLVGPGGLGNYGIR